MRSPTPKGNMTIKRKDSNKLKNEIVTCSLESPLIARGVAIGLITTSIKEAAMTKDVFPIARNVYSVAAVALGTVPDKMIPAATSGWEERNRYARPIEIKTVSVHFKRVAKLTLFFSFVCL